MLKKKFKLDWENCPKNHVALQLAYVGFSYNGLAIQENTPNTVEEHLFGALARASLIKDRQSSNYSRCGRTDKGVSALGNVVSLYLRSRPENELNYTTILNNMLPPDIRIVSHTLVDEFFDARFSCLYREYKYFFNSEGVNVDLLQEACEKFVGLHDFRHFCKADSKKLKTTVRRVLYCKPEGPCITVRGFSFLWHQVRCMVGVALAVSKGKMPPQIIDDMLNVDIAQGKPNYHMASEIGLVLYHCAFENVRFQVDQDSRDSILKTLKVIYS